MQMQQGQDNYTKKPEHNDRLVQERHNFIANALELRLSGTNPSIYIS